jgi:transposase-like protein
VKRRRWTSQQKAQIVLEGIQGRPVAEICNEYQISQAQYYQWRDQFLSNMDKAFETKQATRREQQLEQENARLKTCVAELTLEVKKNEW